jgi:hypothetical protein
MLTALTIGIIVGFAGICYKAGMARERKNEMGRMITARLLGG